MEQLKVAGRKYIESLNSSSPKQHKVAAQSLTSALSNVAGSSAGSSYSFFFLK